VGCAGLGDEIGEVGAAAEDDVLRVNGLAEGRVRVGVGAASDERAALEESYAGSIFRKGNCCGETRGTGSDYGYVC
jgi:hypothetical protein